MVTPFQSEWTEHSGWNGMEAFHSIQNELVIPFRPEWNAIPRLGVRNMPPAVPGVLRRNIKKYFRASIQLLQPGRIFLTPRRGMAFHSGWNGMVIPFRPEWTEHSGWNGSFPFHPEWNGHSIPAGMDCSFHSEWKGIQSYHFPWVPTVNTIINCKQNQFVTEMEIYQQKVTQLNFIELYCTESFNHQAKEKPTCNVCYQIFENK